ncbi:MAG TPA: TIGR02206 family membrane protein [Nocardioides sp.]|nr:TIGR02206 family membrane protein [Nocardioides sp.]
MTPYGLSHLVPLVVFACGLVGAVVVGRRHRTATGPTTFSRAWAVLVAAVGLFQAVALLVDFDLGVSLPLHLCRLTWIAVAVALWTHRPFPVALAFLWGGLLSTQAVLTPSLGEDFPDPRYLAFWALHLMEVWAAVYLVVGLRLAPRWRDLAATVAATLVWAVCAMAFNAAAGTNYGYLRHKPAGSFLDLLGPWPWYVAAEIVVVSAVWALMTLAARRWSRRSPDDRPVT